MRRTIRLIGVVLCMLMGMIPFTGCSIIKETSAAPPTYEMITPEEAKAIMDTDDTCLVLDVRSEEEYRKGHIEGAFGMDYEDVPSKAEAVFDDKEQLILVYCRSGRRSKIAAQSLCDLGYTNVKEFGGVIDWPYGLVTE